MTELGNIGIIWAISCNLGAFKALRHFFSSWAILYSLAVLAYFSAYRAISRTFGRLHSTSALSSLIAHAYLLGTFQPFGRFAAFWAHFMPYGSCFTNESLLQLG